MQLFVGKENDKMGENAKEDQMKYVELINGLIERISPERRKAVSDLANVLDDDVAQIDPASRSWEMPELVRLREEYYHFLCAIFQRDGLPLPEFEPVFFETFLPKKEFGQWFEKAQAAMQATVKHTREHFKGNRGKTQLRKSALAAAAVWEMFPGIMSGSSISVDNLKAVINHALIASGFQPIRPDYQSMELSLASGMAGPAHETKVLIVDDRQPEIMRSAKKLLGWPNLDLDFYLVQKAPMDDIANRILTASPNIVLMDQEMGDIRGDFLIEYLWKRDDGKIAFVANTGGGGAEMRQIGVVNNFAKGQNVDAFRQALKSLPT